MRSVYVIDFREDESGDRSREVFGSEARARAYLRTEDFKCVDDRFWVKGDGDGWGFTARIVKEVVR